MPITGEGALWSLMHSLSTTVSLVQWVNRLLPATGGSGSLPRGAPTPLELGSPVRVVSLQYIYIHTYWYILIYILYIYTFIHIN
jgi:hypothetical protein